MSLAGLSLQSIRTYLQSCAWFQSGLLTADLTQVIDYLESTPDARWIVAETKRATVLVAFWREQVNYTIRRAEIELAQKRDSLDKGVRERLVQDRRPAKSRSVEAGIFADAEYGRLADAQHQREMLRGVLDGIEAALDPSLAVQEVVAARRQEEIDNKT